MPLLFEDDYRLLIASGLEFEEDETKRFLVLKNFPLRPGMYVHAGQPLNYVEVLWVVPENYNSSGGDMFWVHPALERADGKAIPNAFGFGKGDSRIHGGKEYCRWSRHWQPATWKPKVDNIEKVLSRIEWALKKPDANK